MNDTHLNEHGDLSLSLAYFKAQGLSPDTRVLDIGTRFGSLVNAMMASGYPEVLGIDMDAQAIEMGVRARPHLRDRLLVCDGKQLPFPCNAFDAVTMFDVMEHIPDVQAQLREVLRVLHPRGLLIFQTPNRYVNIPWEIVQHRSLTQWRRFHCSLQTLCSLRRLLAEAGFEELCIQKYNAKSEYKRGLAQEKLGPIGTVLVTLAARMPLALSPNFWGHARKPESQIPAPPRQPDPERPADAPSGPVSCDGRTSLKIV
jgi:SAM-dependent methyltransferase